MDNALYHLAIVPCAYWQTIPVGFPLAQAAEAFDVALSGTEIGLDVEYKQGVCSKMSSMVANYVFGGVASGNLQLVGQVRVTDMVFLESNIRYYFRENPDWIATIQRMTFSTPEQVAAMRSILVWLTRHFSVVQKRHLLLNDDDKAVFEQVVLPAATVTEQLLKVFTVAEQRGQVIVFICEQ